MTLQEHIDKLQRYNDSLNDSLKNKDVKVAAPNGMMFDPAIKISYKEIGNFTPENVDCLVITYK